MNCHLIRRTDSSADNTLATWRTKKATRFQTLSRVEKIRELYRETPIVVGGGALARGEGKEQSSNWTKAIETKTNPANLYEGYNLGHFVMNTCPTATEQKSLLNDLLDYICKDLNQGCDKPSTGARGDGITPIFNAAILGMGKDEGRLCAEYLRLCSVAKSTTDINLLWREQILLHFRLL